MNTPLFEGELVRLSALRSDAEAETIVRWSRDSEFLRLMDEDPARPWSVKEIKEELDETPKPYRCEFLIRTRDDDRAIGFINLAQIDGVHGSAWVGIGIGDRAYWGKGYGTDAMRVILRYAFTELNLQRVTLGVFEHNARAIRSYEKAGFVMEGRVRQEVLRDGRRWDGLYMGILRDEWLRANR
jgi:RimJ/RimL family protein N-acetyltransferase